MTPSAEETSTARASLWEAFVIPSLVNLTVALIFGVVTAAGVAIYTINRDATFQAQTTILLDHPDVAAVPNVNPIIRLNALRTTYAALVSTELIADPVAERFGIDPGIVRSNVDVGVTTDSLVMYVIARAGGPTEAEALAEEVSDELVRYVDSEQDDAGIGAADRVTLLIVDHARFGDKISPTATDAVSAASLFGAIGMAVGYAGLQFATAGRRIRRARRQG
jgi:capsular polysaccharide biosynthesis protein